MTPTVPSSRPKWILAVIPLSILMIGLVVGGCAFFKIRSKNDVVAYLGMSRECPPIWKDLALRRIMEGDTVEHLWSLHPPSRERTFGPFTMYSFDLPGQGIRFTNLNVLAREGRLVFARAGSCTWTYTFFGSEETVSAFYKAVSEAGRPEDR